MLQPRASSPPSAKKSACTVRMEAMASRGALGSRRTDSRRPPPRWPHRIRPASLWHLTMALTAIWPTHKEETHPLQAEKGGIYGKGETGIKVAKCLSAARHLNRKDRRVWNSTARSPIAKIRRASSTICCTSWLEVFLPSSVFLFFYGLGSDPRVTTFQTAKAAVLPRLFLFLPQA
jgi:hypothetical protein